MSFTDIDQDKNEIAGDLVLLNQSASKPHGISHYVVYWGKPGQFAKRKQIAQVSVELSDGILHKFEANTPIIPAENEYFLLFLKDQSGKETFSGILTKLKDVYE